MSESIPEIFSSAIADIAMDKFHIKPQDNTLYIHENEKDAKCKLVKIKLKNSIPSFCFSIDVKRQKSNVGNKEVSLDPVFPFFNVNKNNLCSKNDAILICQKHTKTYIFLIELKSGDKQGYLHQLKSSELLVNFIIDRINLSSEKPVIKKEQLEFRGILFWCPRKNDYTTRRKKYKANFTDRNGLLVADFICSENITFYIPQFLA